MKLLSKPDKYAEERELIKGVFEKNKGRYGYRRVHAVLRLSGCTLNHKTTQRLMAEMGLQGRQRRNKYKSCHGTVGAVAPNVLDRNFAARMPYEKLVTDVTEFSVCDEKVYLSPVLDLFNGEILSYSISLSPNFAQTREMMLGLFSRLPDGSAPLLHSDQGWQYQMREFQDMLREHGMTQSMSRKGNCLDNAMMENFFGLMKNELLYVNHFESIEEFERELKKYIWWYNNKRIKLRLKGMSPAIYRAHYYREINN